jgi:putative redox protein
MNDERPPTVAELSWKDGLVFEAVSKGQSMTLDGDAQAGPSPVMTLAFALAGCMGTDLVHILRKGRADLRGLRAHFVAHRLPTDPHRFESVELRFDVTGPVEEAKVARAIALSREKYCSVWHSMRQDIAFTTSFTVAPDGGSL